MEACNSFQAIEAFAHGEGLWHKLPPEIRARQLDAMADLLEELYPTFRWFLYDGLQRYSVPITIFGPLRAAIYVGQMYLVFQRSEEHTSELQSLMRISYAVFCLKKKKTVTN